MDYWPWAYGYLTWFLADAVECGVGKRAELEKALAGLFANLAERQQSGGGWSYLVATDPKDVNQPLHLSISFTTGAIVAALEHARSVSIAVPEELFERAVACLEQMRGSLGSFDYAITHDAPRGLQPPQMVGASGRDAFLSHVLELAGHGRPGDVERALERFRSHLQELGREQGKSLMHCGPEALGSHYVFFDYANTARVLAESNAGRIAGRSAEAGARFRVELRDELRERVLAARLADGSFIDNPLIGRAYGTAMALQALRFLRKD
jgi:hypothetical protein